MKRLVVILSVLSVLSWSCTKTENTIIQPIETKPAVSKKQDFVSVKTPFEVKNGILKFKDLRNFLNLMDELSDNPTQHYSREALDNWEKSLGFISLRNNYQKNLDNYEILDSEQKRSEFASKYKDVLNFSQDKLPMPKIQGVLSWVLDEKNAVYIGETLNLFIDDKQIVILDGNETKIDRAKELKKSYPEAKIDVHQFIEKLDEEREACIKSSYRECNGSASFSGDFIKEKRVFGNWQIYKYVGYTSTWSEYIYPQFSAYLRSEQRHKWWGWQKNHGDNVSWSVGYGINTYSSSSPWTWTGLPPLSTNFQYLGTSAHGTGWTQNSWEIGYAKSLK